MSIKAVVFDIGGVLEITPSMGVQENWEKLLGLRNGELARKIEYISHAGSIGTITENEFCLQFGELLRLKPEEVRAFMDDMWEEYLGTPNVELIQFLLRLRVNYKTGIISNSFVGAREREQKAYGFDQMTDCIIYSHEVEICKPDPRIYFLACEQLNIKPFEMIFLDDDKINVDSACHLGIKGILFANTQQAIADIMHFIHTSN